MPSTPTRFPGGSTNATPNSLFADYPWRAPNTLYEYFNDFSTYAAGDWVVTSTNSGTSALDDGEGGILKLTTGATSTNYQAMQLTKLSYYATTGYRHWFEINFKLSSITHVLFLAGWVDTLAGPMAPASGIYFSKLDASSTVNLILNNATVTTTVAVGTLVANTWTTLGWYYDARDMATLYAYSSIGLTLPVKQQEYQVYGGVVAKTIGQNSATNPTLTTNLPAATVGHTMGFGVTTGTNTAISLFVDHVCSSSAVNRF